jgi:hypothetical protein
MCERLSKPFARRGTTPLWERLSHEREASTWPFLASASPINQDLAAEIAKIVKGRRSDQIAT